MSIKILLLLLVRLALVRAAIGYVFRLLLVSARRHPIEIEATQLLLDAREKAEKITAEAERAAREMAEAAEGALAKKEEKLQKIEERVFRREETLDKKQADLDAQVEGVKARSDEVAKVKERAEALVAQRADELAKVAGLT